MFESSKFDFDSDFESENEINLDFLKEGKDKILIKC